MFFNRRKSGYNFTLDNSSATKIMKLTVKLMELERIILSNITCIQKNRLGIRLYVDITYNVNDNKAKFCRITDV